MIQEEKTIDKYGYSSFTLSEGSNKKVVVSCDYCNVSFDKLYKGIIIQRKDINKDCCNKCKYKKREEISLLKYGVRNSAQRKDIKAKLCNYSIEEYKDQILSLLSEGYSVNFISEKVDIPRSSLNNYVKSLGVDIKTDNKDKIKKTIEEKYGSNFYDMVLQKRKQTNLEKYGYEHSASSPEVKEKIKQSNIKKYGYDHHFKNSSKKLELIQKVQSKYGVDNVFQIPEIKDKIKQTKMQNRIIRSDYQY